MRIWDIGPGFLNNQSLLGEHRELHGIYSIISNGKRGYSRHPETLRWVGKLGALRLRHEMLIQEMRLRGFRHQSPLQDEGVHIEWPSVFIDEPGRQYSILKEKYAGKACGRLPLPSSSSCLWANHKYSVLARDPERYGETGRLVAEKSISFDALASLMVDILRVAPPQGRLENALLHMWGYISEFTDKRPEHMTKPEIMEEIRTLAFKYRVEYLIKSTALGELAVWI